ncbi:MAG: RdgB/HAM1 family non-canonical purine NTP pyrophosphatase [Coriobacteriia bacterium]|nr:RdgB/HAM1 family non-canonical purine NTP pyrophosphatase [Coriobacteriia bacterium]
MKRVIIASNNAHKVDEIRNALDFPGWEFFTLREAGIESDPVEDGDGFEANARIKAEAARAAAGGDCAVLADDSGIEVDALGGAPGVYSSRYAGEDGNDAANNEKLFRELADVPDEQRTGRFVCTLVFIDEDGTETVARGTVEGHIGHELRGENGFGYDPLFLPDEFGGEVTFAEVPQERKSAISHRGNALRLLKEMLQSAV